MAGAVGVQIQNDEVLTRPVDHQVAFIVLRRSGPAKYATAASFLFLNILVAPRTPQMVHKCGNRAYELCELSPDEVSAAVAAVAVPSAFAELFTRSFSSLLGLK